VTLLKWEVWKSVLWTFFAFWSLILMSLELKSHVWEQDLAFKRNIFKYTIQILFSKALRSKVLTKLSSRFLSWNEFSQFLKFEFNVIFCNFWKVWNRTISEISVNSEHSENPVSKLYQTFSKLFDPKTVFFTQKQVFLNSKTGVFLTQKQVFLLELKFYVVLFESFIIDVKFWLISKLFSELKFQNFIPNFFAKISRVRKFHEFKNSGYFQKNSELRKTNFSEACKNEKFGNFCLTQGLTFQP